MSETEEEGKSFIHRASLFCRVVEPFRSSQNIRPPFDEEEEIDDPRLTKSKGNFARNLIQLSLRLISRRICNE